MATALPRASRSSNGPPDAVLPTLPMSKVRKSTGNLSVIDTTKPSHTLRSNSLRRAPSSTLSPVAPASNQAAPAQHKALSSVNAAGKTLRKSISITSFPQPPKGDTRSTSMPISPLAGDKPRSRKSKSPKDFTPFSYASSTPSLLNGSGEGKSISSARMSDGLISISSPPQSRSSSAQDSYSTSATTYDDSGEGSAQRTDSTSSSSDKRLSGTEGKGDVIVSVRVRPDSNTDQESPDGEWMVDGRKSLIAFRGKEGGDHHYGTRVSLHRFLAAVIANKGHRQRLCDPRQ